MELESRKNDAYLRLHLAVLLAGGTGIFGRLISLSEVPLVWFRMLMGAIALGAVMYFSHRVHKLPKAQLLRIGACGMLLAAHWVMFYASIKASNVSIAVVCIALNGFFTAILDPIISKRRLLWREIAFSFIALAGILLIFGLDTRYRLGITIGVISSCLYTLFAIFSKRMQQETGQTSSTMLLYELISGWLLLTIVLPFYCALNPAVSVEPTVADWIMLPIFGSVFTVGPFLLQLQALRSISAFTVNLSFNLEPIYSIIFALIIFDEGSELNRSFWCGVLLIILSVVLQTIYSKREAHGIQHGR